MRKTAIKLFLLLSVILGVSAAESFAQQSDLAGRRWILIEANGRRIARSNAFIEINSSLTRFTGNSGCNQMFGNVRERGVARIDFSGIGSTKRFCKLPAGSVPEAAFLQAMNNAVRYQINGQRLSLMDRRGRTILRFRADSRQVPDDPDGEPGRLDLEDRKWFLESIGNRRTFAPITGVFINFGERRNSAGGDTGCNAFGGSYTKRGTTLSITGIISTQRACEEGGKMTTEREFLNGLRRTNRYEIRQNRLFLYRNNELLLTLRGETK